MTGASWRRFFEFKAGIPSRNPKEDIKRREILKYFLINTQTTDCLMISVMFLKYKEVVFF